MNFQLMSHSFLIYLQPNVTFLPELPDLNLILTKYIFFDKLSMTQM